MMRRRAALLAFAVGILTLGALHAAARAPIAISCDECASNCNNIPMDPQDCLQLYCPECADSSPVG